MHNEKPISRWMVTMVKSKGSVENVKAYMADIASKGGKNSSGYEFSHGKISPVEAGKLGGRPRKNKISV